MKLENAVRENIKLKLAIQGKSGSGKTYSALLISKGLSSDMSKVAVIDTENKASQLYVHLGGFKVLDLKSPYTPQRFIEAINLCVQQQMEVVIIDCLSAEWNGAGGLMQSVSSLGGNTFVNWNKFTPQHDNLIQTVLSSNIHIIATIRTKQGYILTDRNGKLIPEKSDLKGIQRPGYEYDFTTVLELDGNHLANKVKDRTGLFSCMKPSVITEDLGKQLREWCTEGIKKSSLEDIVLGEQSITATSNT